MLDVNWGKFLNEAGFEPLILPLLYDFTKSKFDGLILTGGNDLSTVSGSDVDKMRDDFEISLIDYCIHSSIPIFGICRGMQIINSFFGGTLKKVQNHIGVTHILDNGLTVNSFHGFAIDKLGNGLKSMAKSEDTVIEIIQHEQYKIYAQMHHPERILPFSDLDLDSVRNYFS
jgi:putative glutamine amidotransferase